MSNEQDGRVAAGRVVRIHYTLKNEAGDVLDTSAGGDPMPYLHGHRNIVPGLEKALEGRAAGDRFQVVVPPGEAYGERADIGLQAVPRRFFPDDVAIEPGMQFVAETPEGRLQPFWVAGVQDDVVLLDVNHPLAGVALHFSVEVVDVREATPEELEHGHPHPAA